MQCFRGFELGNEKAKNHGVVVSVTLQISLIGSVCLIARWPLALQDRDSAIDERVSRTRPV